jgi:nucleotide-binding universal stress UspA family protein
MTPAIHRLLVPIDFSAGSNKATEHAAALAAALGASIHLLHVVDESFASQAPWEFYMPDSPRRGRTVQETESKLAAIEAGFRRTGAKVTIEVRSGRAAREIVAVAADRGTDLIVMGTHGRTGLSHVMYGSVAEQVVRKATCPVLAVCEPRADYMPTSSGAAAMRVS